MSMELNLVKLSVESQKEIVKIWEESVHATHYFLKEEDIEYYKLFVDNAVRDMLVPFYGIKDPEGNLFAFMAVDSDMLEMLFVHPSYRMMGVGKKLLHYAVEQLEVKRVDVNEQNNSAVGFYLHEKFVVMSRSERDGFGKDYPILHLRLLG